MRVSELERERERGRERWRGTETRRAVRKSNPTPEKAPSTVSPRTQGQRESTQGDQVCGIHRDL